MFQALRFSLFSLVIVIGTGLWAQSNTGLAAGDLPTVEADPIIVTANRTETPLNEVGSSVSVITAQEMQRNGHIQVLDALRDIAGIDVVRTGGPGTIASIFMRGAESGHTLVIVDGVEMNDPISTSNSFNMTHLTVDNIDRVEIVRGPQSTLYGSDSLGGVIQIITKKGSGKPNGNLHVEGGSFGTQRGSASLRGGTDRWYYSTGASYQDSDGFSAANEALGNVEEDGYRNTSLSAQVGLTPNETWNLELTARHTDASAEIDNGGGAGQDDPNYVSDSVQTTLALRANITLMDGQWQQNFGVSYMDQDRELLNGIDEAHPVDRSYGDFEGIKTKIHWQNHLQLGAAHNLTIGAETENEEGHSIFESDGAFGPFRSEFQEQEARTTGIFLQDQWQIGDRANVTLGIRFDDHDRFGSRTTYRGALAYRVNDRGTLVRASWGTGFKAPSLFQLYSSFGDQDLDPEKSQGADLGITHTMAALGLQMGVTYFRNDFETLIDFDNASFTYNNIDEAQTVGVEWFLRWYSQHGWQAALEGTFQDTEDEVTGEALFRRPDEKIQGRIGYQFGKRGQVNLSGRYVGPREFNDFASSTGRTTLAGYTVFAAAGQVRIIENLQLTARLENVSDKAYEEVLGYGVSEAAGYFGLRFNY